MYLEPLRFKIRTIVSSMKWRVSTNRAQRPQTAVTSRHHRPIRAALRLRSTRTNCSCVRYTSFEKKSCAWVDSRRPTRTYVRNYIVILYIHVHFNILSISEIANQSYNFFCYLKQLFSNFTINKYNYKQYCTEIIKCIYIINSKWFSVYL